MERIPRKNPTEQINRFEGKRIVKKTENNNIQSMGHVQKYIFAPIDLKDCENANHYEKF